MTGKTATTLNVNGGEHRISVEPRRTLADALREECGLQAAPDILARHLGVH